ncbi:MAG: methionine biosynthesis protein MetW [Candidatus Marinamargulisbacteria bacterium]
MKLYEQIVLGQIKSNERVIDLGCGSGGLLQELRQKKQCEGYGIENDFNAVMVALEKGIPVYQGDVLEGLKQFETNAFDVAILSQTLQQVINPLALLQEMCRVSKRAIITFPNFGYWRVRLHLLLTGVPPITKQLPFEWFDTPNIRVITNKEFRQLCHNQGYKIIKEIPLIRNRIQRLLFPIRFTNFLTEKGIFIIEKSS